MTHAQNPHIDVVSNCVLASRVAYRHRIEIYEFTNVIANVFFFCCCLALDELLMRRNRKTHATAIARNCLRYTCNKIIIPSVETAMENNQTDSACIVCLIFPSFAIFIIILVSMIECEHLAQSTHDKQRAVYPPYRLLQTCY